MDPMSKLGELLLKRAVITIEQLVAATRHQQEHGEALASSLDHLGIVSEQDLALFLHREFRLPIVDSHSFDVVPEVLQLIPAAVARKHDMIPLNQDGSTLTLAMADPSNFIAVNVAKFLSGCNVRVVLAPSRVIRKAIGRFYSSGARSYEDALTRLSGSGVDAPPDGLIGEAGQFERAAAEEAPLVKLVNTILFDAIDKRASDIHIEPYEKDMRVRFRIDGVLHDIMQPPARFKNALASRIKIMASLDITNRRLPQDGAIRLPMSCGQDVGFRVSVLPTVFGEKLVLRILDKSALRFDLGSLGFEPAALRQFREAIARPFGMVLVTGPTGSGKSTTLYSALSEINRGSRNISTVEDPVELNVRGLNQVQVNEEIGLTFAATLRSFLRQDPDVIMVGEIRDRETAEISIQAALTGHLVLSTLHTNDAASTMNRLLDMGVEPFLVSSSVILVVAQRLVRLICSHCKTRVEDRPSEALAELGFSFLEASQMTLFRGSGCEECASTGYRGRVALYEVMPIDEELRRQVLSRRSADEIRRTAIASGMKTLRHSGLIKVREGLTTIEEILRTTVID